MATRVSLRSGFLVRGDRVAPCDRVPRQPSVPGDARETAVAVAGTAAPRPPPACCGPTQRQPPDLVGTARQPPTATRASPTMTGQITQDPPWSFLALGPGRRQKAAARAPGPQTRPRRASGLCPAHTGHTRAQPPQCHNDRQTPLHRAQGRRRPLDRAQGLRLRPPQPHGPLRAETWPETWRRRGRPRPGPSRAAGDAGFGARRGGARVSVGCACVCGSLWPESSRREGLRSQRQGQEGPRGDALLRGRPASPRRGGRCGSVRDLPVGGLLTLLLLVPTEAVVRRPGVQTQNLPLLVDPKGKRGDRRADEEPAEQRHGHLPAGRAARRPPPARRGPWAPGDSH